MTDGQDLSLSLLHSFLKMIKTSVSVKLHYTHIRISFSWSIFMNRSHFFSCLLFFLVLIQTVVVFAPQLQASEDIAVSGTIIESMNVSGYTYMQVNSAGEQIWVAVPETSVTVGDEITFAGGMEMKNFYSKTLNRTFESIIFSSGILSNSPAVQQETIKKHQATGQEQSFAEAVQQEKQDPQEVAQQNSSGSAGATVPFLEVHVEKAAGENSVTVAEVFSRAKQLDGKTVRVRGKVVKLNPNIMGKNWIHLQDGSGDPMNNSHDLVITTSGISDIDSIITVEGVVAAEKDFGFGYKYKAIVEEAVILQ